jgi:hypothetical protein
MKKLALVGVLCFFPMVSMAASVTYLLHDVVFDDGGTASGSFDWPSEDGASNISITTTAGQARGYSVTYTRHAEIQIIGVNFGLSLISNLGSDTSFWAMSLDNDGPFEGAYYLTADNPMLFDAYYEGDSDNLYKRFVVSGFVAPAPLPGAFWLFSISVIGMLSINAFHVLAGNQKQRGSQILL